MLYGHGCHGNFSISQFHEPPRPVQTAPSKKVGFYGPQSTLECNRIKKRSHLAPALGTEYLLTSKIETRTMKKGGSHLREVGEGASASGCFSQSTAWDFLEEAPPEQTGGTAISWSQPTPSTRPDCDDDGAGGICKTVPCHIASPSCYSFGYAPCSSTFRTGFYFWGVCLVTVPHLAGGAEEPAETDAGTASVMVRCSECCLAPVAASWKGTKI